MWVAALSPLVSPGEALVVGVIGALLVVASMELVIKCKIDDPVGATAVHAACGIWSLVAVGLFAAKGETEEKIFESYGQISFMPTYVMSNGNNANIWYV